MLNIFEAINLVKLYIKMIKDLFNQATFSYSNNIGNKALTNKIPKL